MATDPGTGGREATVSDVAKAARVSKATAARALGDYGAVSEDVRDRVQAAAERLGYRPNALAKSMNTGKSNTIGVVIGDIENPFFARATRGISDVAQAAGFDLILANSDEEVDAETAAIELLLDKRVDGFIVTPASSIETRSLQTALAEGRPVVLLDRRAAGMEADTVVADNASGAAAATRHLLAAGHRRVAFVGGPSSIGQVRERLQGARAVWDEFGMPEDDLIHLPTEALTVNEGRSAGERLAGLPSRRRPTAAFCANDLLALGLLQHAVTAGLRVPDDLAIVGFDDIDFAAAAAVPLTSVRQPRQELGRTAARLVLDEATNPDHVHEQATFVPALVARASTGTVRR
jgi:LacI family transcriptional regulator